MAELSLSRKLPMCCKQGIDCVKMIMLHARALSMKHTEYVMHMYLPYAKVDSST